MAAFGAGFAVGPLAAGALFDTMHTYDAGLIAVGAALLAGGAVGLTLGPYPDASAQEQTIS